MSNASLQRDAFTLIRPHHQRVTRSRYTVTQTTATTLHEEYHYEEYPQPSTILSTNTTYNSSQLTSSPEES